MAPSAWTLATLVLTACGGSQPTPSRLSNGVPVTAAAPLLVTDAPMDCTSSIEDAAPGNHDRFAFVADELYGYKNGKGVVVIAPTLPMAYEFKPGGIAAVVDAKRRFGFIDTGGNLVARAYAFDNGPDYFQEGFARIVDDSGKLGFISDRGVIPDALRPRFTSADSFCHGTAKVEENGQAFFIDRTGAVVNGMDPARDAPH